MRYEQFKGNLAKLSDCVITFKDKEEVKKLNCYHVLDNMMIIGIDYVDGNVYCRFLESEE